MIVSLMRLKAVSSGPKAGSNFCFPFFSERRVGLLVESNLSYKGPSNLTR